MPKLKINQLSEQGLHPREIDALDRISNELPPHWLAYSNFEFRGKSFGNREIDLVLVTDTLILLVELKDWNGTIEQSGSHWIQNNKDRGESPVAITNRKAQLLKGLIAEKEKHNLTQFYVAPIVVLCGTADARNLDPEERGFVCTLDEFVKIGNAADFNRLFPNSRPKNPPLNRYKEVFNRVFSKHNFNPRKLRYLDYLPDGAPIFRHQDDLYQEFTAHHEYVKGYRALLRTWALTNLPPQFSTKPMWKQITERERQVIGFIRAVAPSEIYAKNILTPIGQTPEEEFSSQYYELFELPPQAELLDTYIRRARSNLTLRDRTQIIENLVSVFAALHQEGIAHRDISPTSVWTGDGFDVAISRWLASHFPETETVGSVRGHIHSGRSITPEDRYDDPSDPFRRDVFLLGVVAYLVLTAEDLPLSDGVAEFDTWPEGEVADTTELVEFRRAIENALDWSSERRYATAEQLLSALQDATRLDSQGESDFREELARFEDESIPYSKYPIAEELSNAERHVYRSRNEGDAKIVKVWPSLRPAAEDASANLRLLSLLTTAEALKQARLSHIQEIIDFGVSSLGPFLVVSQSEGESLRSLIDDPDTDLPDRTVVAEQCIEAVSTIHAMGLHHGDVKPENFLFRRDREAGALHVVLVDLPDADSVGHTRATPTYQDPRHEWGDKYCNDRYGVVMTACEVLRARFSGNSNKPPIVSFDSEDLKPLAEQVNELLSFDQPLVDLEPIQACLRGCIQTLNADPSVRITVPIRAITEPRTLYPENGLYQVHINPAPTKLIQGWNLQADSDRYFEVAFVALNGAVRLIWDHISQCVITGDYIESASKYPDFRARGEIAALLLMVPGSRTDLDPIRDQLEDKFCGLIESFRKTSAAEAEKRSSTPPENLVSGESAAAASDEPADPSEVWRALIDAEEGVLPEVSLVDDPYEVPGEHGQVLVQYENVSNQPLEFDRATTTLVQKTRVDGEPFTIGELIPRLTDQQTLGIALRRRDPVRAGDKLVLHSKLAKASYDKRRTAIERLLSRKSIYPGIVEWITGQATEVASWEDNAANGTDEYAQKFDLNESQTAALRKVTSAIPLGLVQGPPGTGKTYFVSVLARWLLEKGAQNILLTGQSHEAVNNCIEKLVGVYKDNLDELDLVRVGHINMCSPVSAKYHIDNIQNRYRLDFERTMEDRVLRASTNLGLPEQFARQFVRVQIKTRHLAMDHDHISQRMESGELSQDEARRRTEALWRSFEGRIRRISTRVADRITAEDIGGALRQARSILVDIHRITNEDAVDRLAQLAVLAFEWNDALASPHGNYAEFLTKTKRVVTGTCVGIAHRRLNIANDEFDWVIVDEAARCSAGEIAVPAQTARRFVMVGDHQQLPPMYTPDLLEEASKHMPKVRHEELLISDFQRAISRPYGKVAGELLTEQYRMRDAIGTLVSDIFYDGALINRKEKSIWDEEMCPEDLRSDVIWMDTAAPGGASMESLERDSDNNIGTSFVNQGEIAAILELLRSIADSDTFLDELYRTREEDARPIGIICAYAGQKRELIRQFRQRSFPDHFQELVKIDTIDSYQGKENALIILSLVRSNPEGRCGFLARPERVNVAVSRAMEKLVVVGSSSMWRGSPTPPGEVVGYIEAKAATDSHYTVLSKYGPE